MMSRPFHFALLTALLAFLPETARSQSEIVPIATDDGVQLKLSYFPSRARRGSAEAKQVTPVVLLHDYKETRAVFNSLVQRLVAPVAGQRHAFAAVTVDLRGHGDSTRQVLPNGEEIDLDASKLRKQDYLAMVVMDMPAVRSFLVGKNDEGELNLNKLCLVGSGMGASVAAIWALQDWSWPPLAIGKQGQDVKALTLISPRWSRNGLSFQLPMRDRELKENVAWMLLYGAEDDKVAADARRIVKQLKRFHPEPKAGAEPQTTSTLKDIALKSRLQGSTLLRQIGASMEDQIIAFLTEHVATKQHAWINRRQRLP
jgi:pimeloyl-ACP methyl ester carboxylesterase